MIQHKIFLTPPPPPEQTLPPSLTPISESVNPQTENTLTAPNLPEQNNPPVVVATKYPRILRGKNLPEVIIPDHNFQHKLKAQVGFVRKSVLLCPSLYLYHDEVRRDGLME